MRRSAELQPELGLALMVLGEIQRPRRCDGHGRATIRRVGTQVARLWAGEVPLHRAFWDVAVIGGLVVNLTTSLLFLVLITADRPVAALIVGYGLSVPYNGLALVAVWRSAGRYEGERMWADLARVASLVWLAALSLT